MIKRFLLMALCVSMVFACFACGTDEKNKPVQSTEAESNVAETGEFLTWMTYGYDKIIASVTPNVEHSNEFTVYLAKGETEGCQIAIYNTVKMPMLVFRLESGENDNIVSSVYTTERTHEIRRKQYPDSLIPYYGRKLTVDAETVLTYMLEFTTTADTPAGDYKYVYKLYNKDGGVMETYTVNLHVWDFALPEDKTFKTAFNISTGYLTRYGQPYTFYFDALVEHGLSPYSLPVDVDSPEADAYMSDPRITAFKVPHYESDERLLACYEKLKSNPVWLEKAYFYPIDEPRTMEHLNEYKALCERLNRLCPDIPVVSPYYTNIQVAPGVDQTQFMADDCNTMLWCPKLNLWDDVNSYEDLDYTPEKSFADRMKDMQAEGDHVWSYVCNDPIDPYAQLFINTKGINQRAMFWQLYQRDIEGFLYWSTTSWGYHGTHISPWNNVHNGVGDGDGKPVYGEGFLFYPGNPVGIPEPVGSIRLKICRDGVEDIETFYLAEELLGKDWIIEKSMEVTDSLTTYCDDATFAAIRIEIGNALEAAHKNK